MKMKYFIPLIATMLLAFSSCSTDDVPVFFFEVLPVDAVTEVPEVFHVNEADTLQVRYTRPSNCHGFDGFEVRKDQTVRTISIIAKVIEDRAPCAALADDVRTAPLIFKPEEGGEVTLRFLTGNTNAGNPEYITLTIPILE